MPAREPQRRNAERTGHSEGMTDTPAPKPTLMTVQGDLKATIRKLMAVAADSRGHATLDSFDERLVSGHVEAAIVLLNLAWATMFAGARRETER